MSAAVSAQAAARLATDAALASFGDKPVKVALVFASPSYEDVDRVHEAVTERLGPRGPVPVIGGTAGACVFGSEQVARMGVSVVLVGGDDIEVAVRSVRFASSSYIEVVPAAESIATLADEAARRGYVHYTCIVLAPGIFVDGEALVAAIRKGAGAHAQLAGGLTGDDLTMDRPRVFADGPLTAEHVVIAGIFSKRPVGIAARHGWKTVGPKRRVTAVDGVHLTALDGRPALEVWLEDARAAGADPPEDRGELALYLANHWELGLVPEPRLGGGDGRELVARAPFAIRDDGGIRLSGAVAEGTQVRLLHATREDLLRAASAAAEAACVAADPPIAGALFLACSGRLAALGDAFAMEPAAVQKALGRPIGGACVFGEIARNVRDVDAFFNTTAVVVAFSS